VKNDYIGSAFFDASASAFILPQLQQRAQQRSSGSAISSGGIRSSPSGAAAEGKEPTTGRAAAGTALGPEWVAKTAMRDFLQERTGSATGYLNVFTHFVVLAVAAGNFCITRLSALAARYTSNRRCGR
jgi:hypothetical protein